MKIFSGVFPIRLGNPTANAETIIDIINKNNEADIYLFPAYCLEGATCGQLMSYKYFKEEIEEAIDKLCEFTEDNKKIIVTAAHGHDNIVIKDGDILKNTTFMCGGKKVSVSQSVREAFDLLLLPTSMPSYPCIQNDVIEFCAKASLEKKCSVAVANSGFGESSADNVFKGFAGIFKNGVIVDFKAQDDPELAFCFADYAKETGIVYARNRAIDYKIPYFGKNEPKRYLSELFKLQVQALYTRLKSSGIFRVVVNVSGGLDSTLALMVAHETMKMLNMPSKNIIAITQPCFGTGGRTYNNAKKLMELLDVTAFEIDIKNSVTAHLADIGADINNHDVVYENAQARERAQVAFDMANKYNAIVMGTGDMSEAALGFCTFGGDTLGHYNVNATVPKTVMQQLIRQLAAENEGELGQVLLDVVETPISPELKEDQKTEDIVGPYILHDFIMYYFAKLHLSKEEIRQYMLATFEEYDDDEIDKWLEVFFKRFKASRFKRAAACEGANLIGFTLPYIPADAEM